MALFADNRAQSIQIGAVLLFGILIIMLAVWQAFVVPNQNQGIEFNHHQEVERDMVELRTEILQAKTTGEDRFTTVQLGTEFPSRVVARNPPDPSGTLRTTENKTIAVEANQGSLADIFGDDFVDTNRFFEYRPRYTEFTDPSTIRYENTVVYKDFGEQNILRSNQRLLRGDRVSIIPLHQEFRAEGRETVSVEPIPGLLRSEEVEDPVVTLETELSEEDWEQLLANEVAADDDLDNDDIDVTDGELTLTLTGTYDLEYAPVGLDRQPFGGERGDDTLEINPASPGDIELVAADWSQNTVTATFRNNADEGQHNSFNRGRIAFFDGGDPELDEVRANNIQRAQNWQIPGNFEELDPSIELEGDSTQEVELVFSRNLNRNQQWFIVELRLASGETATYFIGGNFDNT